MTQKIINLQKLPIELISKIFLYWSSDTSKILRPIIKEYELYIKDNIDTYSFKQYINKKDPRYLFNKHYMKLYKKNNERGLGCYKCGKYIKKNDFYIKRYVAIPLRYKHLNESDFYIKQFANKCFNCLDCHNKLTMKRSDPKICNT